MQVGFVGANIVRPEKLRQPHDFAGGHGIRPYMSGSMLVIDPQSTRSRKVAAGEQCSPLQRFFKCIYY